MAAWEPKCLKAESVAGFELAACPYAHSGKNVSLEHLGDKFNLYTSEPVMTVVALKACDKTSSYASNFYCPKAHDTASLASTFFGWSYRCFAPSGIGLSIFQLFYP